MQTVTSQTEDRHVQDQRSSRSAGTKALVWHLFQMVIAMEVGMTLYHAAFVNLLAPASYRSFALANPLFDYWMMMVAMTLPMIALMRYYKHSWGYCGGMTAAMLAPIILLSVFVLTGLISLGFLHGSGMALMILGMALFMYLRREQVAE